MSNGRFITFEGGEGCGKSTQVKKLVAFLAARGIDVVAVREPGGTPLAERVRALVKDFREDAPVDRAELLLFLAARAQLAERVIRPALARGAWVVSDRFGDSTLAYQGYGRGLDLDFIRRAHAFACADLVPDRTFLLTVDPAVARVRRARREEVTQTASDRIEDAGTDFHARLAEGFRAMAAAEPGRFVTIDANGTPDQVEHAICQSLKPWI